MPASAHRSIVDADQTIGSIIQRRRELAGITLAALGRAAGVTYQQIRKYEGGQNRVAAGTLVAIAAALGCTAAEIMDEVERPRRPAGEGASADLLRQIEALPADQYRSIEAIVAKLATSAVSHEGRAP